MQLKMIKNSAVILLGISLFVCTLLLIRNNNQLTEVTLRFEQMEQKQTDLSQRLASLYSIQNDINDLRAQVDSNAQDKLTSNKSAQQISSINSNLSSISNSLAISTDENKSVIAANNAADAIIQAGYIDPQNWAHADTAIKQLNKEESKVFWEKMFAGIESGNVKLDLDQFESAP